jgi:drug/metabolite transporter (DMT)-like permease
MISPLKDRAGAMAALLSATLFGASTPCAKLLLGTGVSPWLLAALLYLGSGVGLLGIFTARRLRGKSLEAPLRAADLPVLTSVVILGGMAGPVLLMIGLARIPAAATALLLNLEPVATLVLAWTLFHEHVDRRLMIGAVAIVAGAALLSWNRGDHAGGWGALAVAGACLAWALDNNLTRRLSSADPVQLAMIKGLFAGGANLCIALLSGFTLPRAPVLAGVGAVGFVGYGVSLVLFVMALRDIGAARSGAYFSTAPFIGAGVSVLLLHESISSILLLAGLLMAIGIYLHLTERHAHEHEHETLGHEHRHRHDEHHRHAHAHQDPSGEPHSHWHEHGALIHSHPHFPDLHHRHGHEASKAR